MYLKYITMSYTTTKVYPADFLNRITDLPKLEKFSYHHYTLLRIEMIRKKNIYL